ncbi:glycosyltransferase family 4 protein [Blautia schinkii]|nr:glycosyltransferase family 4 protein [Blautia schinkii]
MKKILFINSSIYIPGEKAIKRTFFLFEMMRHQGYDVKFLTSDFNHYEKKQRDVKVFYQNYPEYKECLYFVHKKPYKKNISVKRFCSELQGEKEELKWFIKHGRPFDIVYISWPTYYLAKHIRKYCDAYGIKLVIDINDLWPDSLKMVIKNNTLYDLLTKKFQNNTKVSFSNADGIVAVSEEYLQLACKDNTRATEKLAVYIGAMLDRFDAGVEKYASSIEKGTDDIWITYIGTLGCSYDFETVMNAIQKLDNSQVCFKILGQGPEESRLKALAKSLNVQVDFIGFVEYEKMAAYLSKTDMCVNCIKQRASQSIINKIADYFASGKPVINCGSCQEMIELIDRYDCGINYMAENVKSCADAIRTIISNPERAKVLGENARKLAELKFDRQSSHQEIIGMIERI